MLASFLRRRVLPDGRGNPSPPTHVRRLDRSDDPLSGELTLIDRLSDGDCILCVAGEMIPCDGTVVDGAALIGAAWRDRQTRPLAGGEIGSRVVGGAIVLSNYLIVRVGGWDSPRST